MPGTDPVATTRRFVTEVLDAGRLELAGELVAADVVVHPPGTEEPLVGLAALLGSIDTLRIALGEAGCAADGDLVSVGEALQLRVAGGLIVEAWIRAPGTPAVAGIAALAIDCAAPVELAAWWRRLLGGRVEVDDDDDEITTLVTPGGLRLDFARVPEVKSVKNRLHLDLRTTDLDAGVAQALALGATRADDIYAGGSWQVMRDPEGNEFCLQRPAG